jgi:maltose O-acetyltransferase
MAPVVIEDDVWIGFNSSIMKGVTIGRGAIVGASSVITKDVSPYSIVVGNPQRQVGNSE